MSISRRDVLTGLALSLSAGCGSDNTATLFQPASAQVPPIPQRPREPSFLYVQNAESGSLIPRGGDEFELRFQGAEETLYFSDRPARLFGSKPTADFVTRDFPGFGSDPPNAALQLGGARLATVLKLLSAAVQGADLVYRCRALPAGGARYEGNLVSPQGFPTTFGKANLFIDNDSGDLPEDNALVKIVSDDVVYEVLAGTWHVTGGVGTVTFNNETVNNQMLTGITSDQQVVMTPLQLPLWTSNQQIQLTFNQQPYNDRFTLMLLVGPGASYSGSVLVISS